MEPECTKDKCEGLVLSVVNGKYVRTHECERAHEDIERDMERIEKKLDRLLLGVIVTGVVIVVADAVMKFLP